MKLRSIHKNLLNEAYLRTWVFANVFVLMFIATAEVFAWSGSSHSKLAGILLADPTVSPFIGEFNVDANAVKGWTSEPPDAWHHPGWTMLNRRGYLGIDNGMNWAGLDETTRLRYLIHIAVDCGVPLGHSPANETYDNTGAELHLEGQVATWDSYPSIAGQTGYRHSSTGYSAGFTGTYWDILNTFYGACLNNASWYEGKENILGLHSSDTNRTAAWAGTTLGQYLGRAMLVDYFLAKRETVAVAGGPYAVNPDGHVTLSSVGSQDPDSISWNVNGTYTNNGGGLSSIAWDLNYDGVYETVGSSPLLSYETLYNLLGPTEGKPLGLQVVDNEGKAGYATAQLAVYAPPVAAGKTQYGWLGKAGEVPSAWTWDNLIDSGSYDPDGTAVSHYDWDLNNDGMIDKSGGTSVQVTYDDLSALGIVANENHTVTLTVTDNEGVQGRQSSIACPVLVNPVCEIVKGPSLRNRNETLTLSATGYDPDGGAITEWLWDLNNDGVYESQGQVLHRTYGELEALGVVGAGDHTIGLKVLDNDNSITGGWRGQATTTGFLRMYTGDSNMSVYDYSVHGMDGGDWADINNGTWRDWAKITAIGDKYGIYYNWMDEGAGNGCMVARVWSARPYEKIVRVEFNYVYNADPGLFTPAVYTMGAEATSLSGATPLIWRGTVYGWSEGRMSIVLNASDDVQKVALGLTVPRWGLHGFFVEYRDVVITTVKDAGDANLDNAVDVGDLGILAANYGGIGKHWGEGDFNDDGVVDVGDLGILAANYGTNNSSASFEADYAKVFAAASAPEADEEDAAFSICSGLGLPLVVGLLGAGLALVKLEE